jgi:D-alanyl-D-alanine carboxypeptidase (penicillin-binding protein 5/6)
MSLAKKSILIFLLIIVYISVFLFIAFYPKIFYRTSLPEKSSSLPFSHSWQLYDNAYLKLSAQSAISIEYENGIYHVLYQKDSDRELPIASLTKILTAWVAINKYDLNREITFSQRAINTPEATGLFTPNQQFFLKDVLYSMLTESSNDAAWAISEVDGKNNFICQMNQKAQEYQMENSRFYDPVGLDPNIVGQNYNFSTTNDIFKLLKNILDQNSENRGLLLEILGTKEFDIYTSNNIFHHQAISTNKMIFDLNTSVIAGKTGSSPLAKECLMIITQHPKYQNGYIINILLGSNNRYEDMDNLINWVNNNYIRL